MSATTLPMEHTSTLPQELIDYIVDHASDDKETQKRLSLVNHSWSHQTRRNLFQTVSFELGGQSCARLNEVLQANPSLYQHIQTVRIGHDYRNNLGSPSILGVIDPKKLVDVLHISLCGTRSELDWGDLPPNLRSALYDLLAKPDLITLALTNIWDIDVSKFIGQSRCLKKLVLHDVWQTFSPNPSTLSGRPPAARVADEEQCSLRSLSVRDCGDALECLCAATKVPQPVVLKVYALHYDNKMDMALKSLSGNVETYEINCARFTTHSFQTGILDLTRLPKLKNFKISLDADQLTRPSGTIPSELLQQLDRLRGTNCLEGIDLQLNFPCGSSWSLVFFPLMRDCKRHGVSTWKDLDNILSDNDAFPKLKRLKIVLRFEFPAAPSPQMWNDSVRLFKVDTMPKLNDRSMVEVVRVDFRY
ncbi:hypothetical protein DFP72DRAFT_1100979 [Ephemerocybe angulata]|uniref:Uncharacterized protein n=1 Tax=Ephemerocybe angulata TaxID=980116 RepID=A0A8H6I7X2_9AGAR|nr:hypothetical protein DFP72DRAFT_1100979 [Tulosesus angulatus]